jgi:head-tail adaptor
MLARLTAVFLPKLCAIERYAPTTNANGEQLDAWDPDESMAAIPCQLSTEMAKEQRGEFVVEVLQYRIVLAGRWDVNSADRAIIDGAAYDIRGVLLDSHSPTTTFLARRVV